MAGTIIDMSKIKQLLHLKKAGVSNRQIAKNLKTTPPRQHSVACQRKPIPPKGPLVSSSPSRSSLCSTSAKPMPLRPARQVPCQCCRRHRQHRHRMALGTLSLILWQQFLRFCSFSCHRMALKRLKDILWHR